MKRKLLYLAIVLLYILHQDWWNWADRSLVLGMPIGLTYHAGYCVTASLLMFCLVRYAWPAQLEVAPQDMHEEKATPWH